jgi:eukaryotic-like serine/threonine-protein kinase
MAENRKCEQCGAQLPPNAPQGLCPRCLVGMALSLAGASGSRNLETAAGPARETSSSALGRVRYFGDYELLEEIARGGMGVVYKARQMSLNRIVAVKMLLFGQTANGDFVKRFHAEARAVARLHHPNIVAIHEVGIHEGQHYFSMDYVEGQTLAERAWNNPVPPALAADYLQTIAQAVHYAHRKGVLHRDLKPSNVLIDTMDQPRVMDFGLAKRLQDDSDLTLEGQVLGTPNYIAPEQAAGKRTGVGPVADVYALGAVLYYLLTGRPPFLGESLEETLNLVLHAEPVAPRLLTPAIPRDLETICLKCLEKEPQQRYGSAQALADDLHRWLRREPILARPSTPVERVIKWTKRKPVIAVLSGLMALSLSLGGTAVIWSWRNAVAARERADKALATITEMQAIEKLFARGDDASALAQLARALRRDPANGPAAARVLSALTQYGLAGTNGLRKPFERGSPYISYKLSQDGQYCVLAFSEEASGTSDVLTVPLPVPEWLPELAEAIAEKKVTNLDLMEQVPLTSFQELKARVSQRSTLDVWSRWAKWFFADPAARPVSPFSDASAP